MKKSRKYEKGQAFAELIIGLVAIMAVFMGLLFIAALGTENVDNLITARGEADEMAYDGTVGDTGEPIREWNQGDDGLFFTEDDSPETGVLENVEYVRDQLVTTDDSVDAGNLDNSYVINNFARDFPDTYLFLAAADLTSYTDVKENPIDEWGYGDMMSAFRTLIYNDDFTLSESVYMPMVTD